jgi:3-phytase
MSSCFVPIVFVVFLLGGAVSVAQTPPRQSALPNSAKEAINTPQGGWLSLEKKGLKLVSAEGKELASFPVRGKHLDARLLQGASEKEMIAVLLDSDANQPAIVRVGPKTIEALPALPALAFSIESMCLYRDSQGHTQLFVIGKNGVSEQWLLRPEGHALVRRLALPANSPVCRVDDQTKLLYVMEPRVGLWAYDISREEVMLRHLVAPSSRGNTIGKDIEWIAVSPGAVAIVDRGLLRQYRVPVRAERADIEALWPSLPAIRYGGTQSVSNAVSELNELAQTRQFWLAAKGVKGWKPLGLGSARASVLPKLPNSNVPIVMPVAQTDPMVQFGDAADDPAIWVHPTDATKSRVLGTNKKKGLLVYDLAGRELQYLPVGRVNNVDLRQGVRLENKLMDIAVASHRDDNAIVVFSIDSDGKVKEEARLPTELGEIYGICSGLTQSQELDVFVNDKDGRFLQVRVAKRDERWSGQVLRRFQVASQPEACVVDESSERVFIGEEKRGVWTLSSNATVPAKLSLIAAVGKSLVADVEGLGLYQTSKANYLVVSSQGNDSYVVLDASPPYTQRGVFRVGINAAKAIDGTSETDGLEVTSKPLGPMFPKGMLVVHDGYKQLPPGPQNFKYVSWEAIEKALNLR